MTTSPKKPPHPLRDAKLVLEGHRKDDGQRVAMFETADGGMIEYEVHTGKPPVRLP